MLFYIAVDKYQMTIVDCNCLLGFNQNQMKVTPETVHGNCNLFMNKRFMQNIVLKNSMEVVILKILNMIIYSIISLHKHKIYQNSKKCIFLKVFKICKLKLKF